MPCGWFCVLNTHSQGRRMGQILCYNGKTKDLECWSLEHYDCRFVGFHNVDDKHVIGLPNFEYCRIYTFAITLHS